MSKSTKFKKPTDPAEIARRRMEQMAADAKQAELKAKAERDPEQWGIDQSLGDLETAGDIHASRDITRKITRAKRWDVFALLRTAGSLTGDHIIVVDKLHRLMAIRAHTAGASNPNTPVDGLTAPEYPKAQVEAGVRVDGLFAHIEAQEKALRAAEGSIAPTYRAALLIALSEPTIVHGHAVNNWRSVVERLTGEFREAMQSKAVVEACDALERAVSDKADDEAIVAYYRQRDERVAQGRAA